MGLRALLMGRMNMTTHELMVPAEEEKEHRGRSETYVGRIQHKPVDVYTYAAYAALPFMKQ